VLSTSPHAAASQAAPFTLDYRGSDYWLCDDIPALAALLRKRSDLHEWQTASHDRKAGKELCRYYHKPEGLRHRVEPSGIVLEHSGTVRLVGTDPARCRRILEALQTSGAVEEVQKCLF
jgi:hypothetical protein